MLLHDDDAIDTDFVTACLEAVNHRTDIGIIRTGARRIDGRGGVLGESPNRATGLPTHDFFFAWFDGRTALYMCNTLYNTDKLREIGGLQSRHNLFQDGLATCTLAARYGRVDVEDVKASFRIHAGELTGAAKVSDWCEDSLELLERMCEVVDDSHKEEVRSRGMRFFANVNYSRASKVKPLAQRITAFRHVFRVFGHRYFPSWRLVLAASTLYRGLRRIKRTALGLPQWAA